MWLSWFKLRFQRKVAKKENDEVLSIIGSTKVKSFMRLEDFDPDEVIRISTAKANERAR